MPFAVQPGWKVRVRLSRVDDEASASINGQEAIHPVAGQELEFQRQINPGDRLDVFVKDTQHPFWSLRYQVWLGPDVTQGKPAIDVHVDGFTPGSTGGGMHPNPGFGVKYSRRFDFV